MAAGKNTVTVIGLGLMGTALARAFRDAGHELTVWNRSSGKALPFEGSARVAPTVHDAVAASTTVVISLLDYGVADSLLHTADVESAIAGRTVLQLTTGTPTDARAGQKWARQHNASYLDGAIAGYPRTIGTDANEVFYSGDEAVFDGQRDVLGALGGKATFCGENAGAAATLDLACLEFAYARAAGVLHAAALCAAESFPLEVFFATAGAPSGLLEFVSRHDFSDGATPMDAAVAAAAMTRPREYPESIDATLAVHAAAIGQIVRASGEAGIDRTFPQALHDTYLRAVTRGHGNHDLPSLYEAFVDVTA
jgi:3-hydroxyisobutyrate dehydrogenase-like beta-hydroxyacid dehydrogenase